jgi:hypothetical protein
MIQRIKLRPDLVSDRQLAEKMNEIIDAINEINRRTASLANIGTCDTIPTATFGPTIIECDEPCHVMYGNVKVHQCVTVCAGLKNCALKL